MMATDYKGLVKASADLIASVALPRGRSSRVNCSFCNALLEKPAGACKRAPRICGSCRRKSRKLEKARRMLEEHLSEHRSKGDFDDIYFGPLV